MVLGCDVGGTKTSLALFEARGAALVRLRLETYRSREHDSLDAVVARFCAALAPGERPAAACFGVAGPVSGGTARVTNLPWEIDGARLAGLLGLGQVSLLNDVEAHAWALERLGPAELAMLQGQPVRSGTAAITAAGTGLGFAALVRAATGVVSVASEGGHADFAPGDDDGVELWRWLRARHGHVSVERVLSGPGLQAIHAFLRERSGAPEPAWLAEAARTGEGPPAIAAAGMEGTDELCAGALELFLRALGAEAGSWALRTLARGGAWLAGGIAPKLLFPARAREGWREHAAGIVLEGFRAKGRFRPLLETLPLGVILDGHAALLGAAHHALVASAKG